MGQQVAQADSATATSATQSNLVNQAGAILEKVIGLDNAKLATDIGQYNPDRSRQEVDEQIVLEIYPQKLNRVS